MTDANGNPVDATSLTLQVYDAYENFVLQDDFVNGYGNPATLPTHIVKPGSTVGQYYFPFGDISFDSKNSTAIAGEFLFVWQANTASGPEEPLVQVAKVVSARTMRLLPKLRLIIDKAAKQIDETSNDTCYLGYTDQMLIEFYEQGLSLINAGQPYVQWQGLDQFPDAGIRLLLDGATVAALTSQELFAVDTDLGSYSDNGESFTILHQPALSAILATTWTRLRETVKEFKLHYVSSGCVRIDLTSVNSRYAVLLNAAPPGSLFSSLLLAIGT